MYQLSKDTGSTSSGGGASRWKSSTTQTQPSKTSKNGLPVWDDCKHSYQEKALKFILANPAAGLLLDPGLGKTSISLAAIRVLLDTGAINSVLVIAPLRVCHSVWAPNKEPAKWAEFKDLTVEVLHGPTKVANTKNKADIYVINPEGLKWFSQHFDSMPHKPDMLVVDESTKFKHTNTMRFKVLKKMLAQFKRRYILTGTPTPNGLLDLFGQIFVLDEGASLGRYVTHFKNKYFHRAGFGGFVLTPHQHAFEEVQKLIGPMCLRMDSEDYLELPDKITTSIPVTLDSQASKQYKSLKRDMALRLKSGDVTAMNAAVLTNKCRQFANGAMYVGEPGDRVRREWDEVHTAKLEACVDLVEQLSGEPTLIAYEFEHDLARLRDRFGKDLPVIGGSTSAKQGIQYEEHWNAGALPILAVHPASVSHGLNLQHGGRSLIWFAITWNLEHYDQLVRRVWRQGQKKKTLIYHLVAEGTIDETVLRALRGKDRTQKALLNALKKDLM